MFTGIIQKIGTVRRLSYGKGVVLEIGLDADSEGGWVQPLMVGESIAVNGVCLTVAKADRSGFTADVLKETLSRTDLGELKPGGKVNLERALRAGEAMGGHIVQGHVDGCGEILGKSPRGRDFRLRVSCARALAASSVLKGSVAIDGVSLTITELGDDYLAVDLIPTTARETILGMKRVGEKVNIEGDVLGKLVKRQLDVIKGRSELTEEKLMRAGFNLQGARD